MDDMTAERLVKDLAVRYGLFIDSETLQDFVGAHLERYREVLVQDFVPIFVERELRRSLKRVD